MKVISHSGKWNVGYYEDKVNYLKAHEALYQIEIKKLEVTYESVIVSLEQAYAIFLEPLNEVSLEEYLVYANLIRAGYFVEQHDPVNDRLKYEAAVNKTTVNKEDKMIWVVLMEKLNQPVSSQFINQEFQLYQKTKASMGIFCMKISGIQNENCTKEIPTIKRDLSPQNETLSKRHKSGDNEHQDPNFLDILKSEVEFSTYQNIFKKFNFIKRFEVVKKPDRQMKFNYDVFLPKPNFKRTEDLPNYRIFIIR